jgi:hypothetical protein
MSAKRATHRKLQVDRHGRLWIEGIFCVRKITRVYHARQVEYASRIPSWPGTPTLSLVSADDSKTYNEAQNLVVQDIECACVLVLYLPH